MIGNDDATSEPQFECLWPLGRRAAVNTNLAPRIGDLSGKRVALLWDYLLHGDVMLAVIREALSRRFTGVQFVNYDQFGDTHGPARNEILAQLPARLRELKVDAVISCVGA